MKIKEVLHGTLRRMHHIPRYSSLPVVRRENVAEHSWQITMIAWLIAKDLVRQGYTISVLDVLEKALCHDVSEALSGDIIRSFKHSSEALVQAIKEADYSNMLRLIEELDIPDEGAELLDVWASSKNNMLEGHIVKLADLLCVVSYCTEERALGNTSMDGVMEAAFDDMAKWKNHEFLGRYVRAVYPNWKWDDPYDYQRSQR